MKHILELEHVVSDDVSVAYVVGNSWLKKEYIETDLILGNLFSNSSLGYEVKKIHRFRKRNSGQNLYETIVYASKS